MPVKFCSVAFIEVYAFGTAHDECSEISIASNCSWAGKPTLRDTIQKVLQYVIFLGEK